VISIASLKLDEHDKVVKLSTIHKYIDSRKRLWMDPDDVEFPLPVDTLPFSFSRTLPIARVGSFFTTWYALTITNWLDNVLSLPDPMNPERSKRLLHILASHWRSMNPADRRTVTGKLTSSTIVPTSVGLSKANDSYFASVHKIPGLAVVDFEGCNGRSMRQLLEGMGVKRRADISLLLEK
jgi:hypothetical protein